MDIFFSPGQLDSDNIPSDQALVNWFPLGADLVKMKESSDIFQNGLFSHPLTRRTKGFFSLLFKLIQFLEVNLTIMWGTPTMTGTLGAFNSQSYTQ